MNAVAEQYKIEADLDHELELMVNDYNDRYSDIVAAIDKSIAASYSPNEEKIVLVNTISTGQT
jgi:hypothetical protein